MRQILIVANDATYSQLASRKLRRLERFDRRKLQATPLDASILVGLRKGPLSFLRPWSGYVMRAGKPIGAISLSGRDVRRGYLEVKG